MMKNLRNKKWILALLLALLSLGLVFLTGDQTLAADPPADPPPPILETLEPISPPDETISPQNIGPTAAGTFYPSDDAPVQQGDPNATNPNNFYLGAGYDDNSLYESTGLVRSYLRFDLSSLPANSLIDSATLRLFYANSKDFTGQSRTITFYRVTGNWNEATITWNNMPASAEVVGSVSITHPLFGWKSVDVTNLVQDWADGSKANYGLVAVGPESIQGIYRAFASGETANSPELQINYLPPAPPVLDASPGFLSFQASNTQPSFNSSIQISNVTGNSLNWSASKVGSVGWLSFSPSSGTGVTPTNPDNLDITINPTGLAPGTYTGQIQISSNTQNAANTPLITTFTLDVSSQLSNVYLPIIMKGGGSGGSSPPEVVALVVGISDYQYFGPQTTSDDILPDVVDGGDLDYPAGYDVPDFIDILTKMNVSPNNIIKRTESAASKSALIAAFAELDQMEDENSTVFFYFSGHGAQQPDINGDESDGYDEWIATYDTKYAANGFDNILLDDELEVLFANLESKRIVIIIDSCFSGGLACLGGLTSTAGDLRPRGLSGISASCATPGEGGLSEIAGPGRVVITAGTGNQLTWESTALQNGVFTHFFLQGLEDTLHDTNKNGRISAEEAYWFTRDAVDDWIFTNTGVNQNPAISDQYFGQADMTWSP